ncbi:MAG: hypothetical protein JHC93_07945 [Parachlamydiales bacterium]|nr:hypothetical protein [Parachlamydiales bacterium]
MTNITQNYVPITLPEGKRISHHSFKGLEHKSPNHQNINNYFDGHLPPNITDLPRNKSSKVFDTIDPKLFINKQTAQQLNETLKNVNESINSQKTQKIIRQMKTASKVGMVIALIFGPLILAATGLGFYALYATKPLLACVTVFTGLPIGTFLTIIGASMLALKKRMNNRSIQLQTPYSTNR